MMSSSPTTTEVSQPDVVRDSPTPGEILLTEFLQPYRVSQYRLAKDIGVSEGYVSKVVHGQRAITAEMSLRLSEYFGVSPTFFANLQTIYDTRLARAKLANVVIHRLPASVR